MVCGGCSSESGQSLVVEVVVCDGVWNFGALDNLREGPGYSGLWWMKGDDVGEVLQAFSLGKHP